MMLFAAAFLPKAQHREAVALDGLRLVFQTLEEATARLDEKLLKINNAPRQEKQEHINYDLQVSYTSIMSDIWVVIDNIRRISLLLKFIPGIPNHIAGKTFAVIIDEIKDLRDSLHHIDERTKIYFGKNGESIFGDIIWRYRGAPGLSEELTILLSGMKRTGGDSIKVGEPQNSEIAREAIQAIGIPQDNRFLQRVGNYDLNIRYVRRVYDAASKQYGPEERLVVNLENAIQSVNKIILFLNKKYSKFYNDLIKKSKMLGAGVSFPTTVTVKYTQEAVDRVKNESLNSKNDKD